MKNTYSFNWSMVMRFKTIFRIFFALAVILPLNTYSQNPKIDSLKLCLSKAGKNDRINILYDLYYECVDSDYPAALKYIDEAFSIAKQTEDTFHVVKMGRAKTLVYRRMNEMDSSLNLSLKILPIARKLNYTGELKHIYHGLALAYLHKANYDKALHHFFESLDLRKKEGDSFEISVALHNIGFTYYHLDDYNKALQYYNQALAYKAKSENKEGLVMLLFNISLCYIYQSDLSKGQQYLDQAFALCSSPCADVFLLTGDFNRGLILFKQNNLPEAASKFLSSYSRAKQIGHERLQLDNIGYLVEIFGMLNQPTLAEKYFLETETLLQAGTPFNDEIIELYRQMFLLYQKVGNSEKIIHYQSKYIALRDSIYSKDLTTSLMKLEADYLERENQARIESQNKILSLNEKVINQQKIANASIGGVAVLLIILAILLAKNNVQKRRMNVLLDKKVKERTQELEVNRDALQRAWHERDIIIRAASADIQSSIATIKGLSALGEKEIDHPKAPDYWKELDTTSMRLATVLNKMHCANNAFTF